MLVNMNVKSKKFLIELLYGINILPARTSWNGAPTKLQKRTAVIC